MRVCPSQLTHRLDLLTTEVRTQGRRGLQSRCSRSCGIFDNDAGGVLSRYD